MSQDYSAKKPEDLTKININDYNELLWWSMVWDVSPEKIISIVEKEGSSAELVKKMINTKG